MSVAPTLPPPAASEAAPGSAPPGAPDPPGGPPFDHTLAEHMARTAHAEGREGKDREPGKRDEAAAKGEPAPAPAVQATVAVVVPGTPRLRTDLAAVVQPATEGAAPSTPPGLAKLTTPSAHASPAAGPDEAVVEGVATPDAPTALQSQPVATASQPAATAHAPTPTAPPATAPAASARPSVADEPVTVPAPAPVVAPKTPTSPVTPTTSALPATSETSTTTATPPPAAVGVSSAQATPATATAVAQTIPTTAVATPATTSASTPATTSASTPPTTSANGPATPAGAPTATPVRAATGTSAPAPTAALDGGKAVDAHAIVETVRDSASTHTSTAGVERATTPTTTGAASATAASAPALAASPTTGAAEPTSAPASAADAPLLGAGVEMQDMIDSIRATVQIAARHGIAHARIALQPQELGQLRIHLTQTSDGLLARVTADTPAAAQALAGARAELHRSLSSLGATLLRLDVGTSDQPQARARGEQLANAAGGARSAHELGEGADAGAESEPVAPAANVTGVKGELVDVLA